MGSGRQSSASIRRKAATQEPIPRARESTAATDVTLLRQSCRQPNLISARSDSSHPAARMLWLVSRVCSVDPNARCASLGSRPEAMASSMCACNSSSISRFRRSPDKAFEIRDHKDTSYLPEDPIDCQAHRLPARLFHAKLLFACGGQLVDAGATARVFPDPLRANPACFLHPMQRGVERALLCAQHFAGRTGDGSHNGVPVKSRSPRQYLEHEQIERALQSVGPGHNQMSLYRCLCIAVNQIFWAHFRAMRWLTSTLAANYFRHLSQCLFSPTMVRSLTEN